MYLNPIDSSEKSHPRTKRYQGEAPTLTQSKSSTSARGWDQGTERRSFTKYTSARRQVPCLVLRPNAGLKEPQVTSTMGWMWSLIASAHPYGRKAKWERWISNTGAHTVPVLQAGEFFSPQSHIPWCWNLKSACTWTRAKSGTPLLPDHCVEEQAKLATHVPK